MVMKMPFQVFTLLTVCIVAFASCGCHKESEVPKATTSQSSSAAMPKIGTPVAEGSAPENVPPATAAPAPPAPTVNTSNEANLSNGARPVDENGAPLSDLAWLNQLVTAYNESHANKGSDGKVQVYKTEAEEMAAIERQKNAATAGPLKDLSALVTAGYLKSLPTPPPGKRYAIDPGSHQVVLLSAN